MHHGLHSFHRAAERSAVLHLAEDRLDAETVQPLGPAGAPDESADGVPRRLERLDDVASQETAAAGDQDLHAVFFLLAMAVRTISETISIRRSQECASA